MNRKLAYCKVLVNTYFNSITKEQFVKLMPYILKHISNDSDYDYERKLNNIITIIEGYNIPTINNIDINAIKKDIKNLIYDSDVVIMDTIKIIDIDPIGNTATIKYKRTDCNYDNTISFDYTDYLKKQLNN